MCANKFAHAMHSMVTSASANLHVCAMWVHVQKKPRSLVILFPVPRCCQSVYKEALCHYASANMHHTMHTFTCVCNVYNMHTFVHNICSFVYCVCLHTPLHRPLSKNAPLTCASLCNSRDLIDRENLVWLINIKCPVINTHTFMFLLFC